MVADRLIVFTYLDTDIIQMAVDTVGFEAFALGSSALHFPQMGRYVEFGAELGDNTVDGNTAHDRKNRLNFVFVLFKVEQNLECAAHAPRKFRG